VLLTPADGSGDSQPLLDRGRSDYPMPWAPDRDGRELLSQREQVMVVRVDTSYGFRWDSPEQLFAGQYVMDPDNPVGIPNHDVDLDGQRFLMIKLTGSEDARHQITVVLNWFEELTAPVPVP
jgi:hypothetical protein